MCLEFDNRRYAVAEARLLLVSARWTRSVEEKGSGGPGGR